MRKKLALLCAVGVLACASAAKASSITFGPSDSVSGICCFNVVVNQVNPTEIQLTVNLKDGALAFVNSGNGNNHPGFAFNFTSTIDPTISFPSGSLWGTDTLQTTANVSGNLGTFDYFINNPGSGSNAKNSGPLIFDISVNNILRIRRDGSLSLTHHQLLQNSTDSISANSDISYLNLITNEAGNYFAADIQNSAKATGEDALSSGPTMTPTPEPSSMLLLGTGLVSAAGLLRRRFAVGSRRS